MGVRLYVCWVFHAEGGSFLGKVIGDHPAWKGVPYYANGLSPKKGCSSYVRVAGIMYGGIHPMQGCSFSGCVFLRI